MRKHYDYQEQQIDFHCNLLLNPTPTCLHDLYIYDNPPPSDRTRADPRKFQAWLDYLELKQRMEREEDKERPRKPPLWEDSEGNRYFREECYLWWDYDLYGTPEAPNGIVAYNEEGERLRRVTG